MKGTMRTLSIVVVWLVSLGSAWAQPYEVINPTILEFTVSPDHTDPKVLTGYRADWYLGGAAAPVTQSDLGKPDPNASGLVTLPISDLIKPLNYGQYSVRVVAYGPGGETPSVHSNPFIRSAEPPQPATGVTVKRP